MREVVIKPNQIDLFADIRYGPVFKTYARNLKAAGCHTAQSILCSTDSSIFTVLPQSESQTPVAWLLRTVRTSNLCVVGVLRRVGRAELIAWSLTASDRSNQYRTEPHAAPPAGRNDDRRGDRKVRCYSPVAATSASDCITHPSAEIARCEPYRHIDPITDIGGNFLQFA